MIEAVSFCWEEKIESKQKHSCETIRSLAFIKKWMTWLICEILELCMNNMRLMLDVCGLWRQEVAFRCSSRSLCLNAGWKEDKERMRTEEWHGLELNWITLVWLVCSAQNHYKSIKTDQLDQHKPAQLKQTKQCLFPAENEDCYHEFTPEMNPLLVYCVSRPLEGVWLHQIPSDSFMRVLHKILHVDSLFTSSQ